MRRPFKRGIELLLALLEEDDERVADEIRDQLDEVWAALSEEQGELWRKVSAALHKEKP